MAPLFKSRVLEQLSSLLTRFNLNKNASRTAKWVRSTGTKLNSAMTGTGRGRRPPARGAGRKRPWCDAGGFPAGPARASYFLHSGSGPGTRKTLAGKGAGIRAAGCGPRGAGAARTAIFGEATAHRKVPDSAPRPSRSLAAAHATQRHRVLASAAQRLTSRGGADAVDLLLPGVHSANRLPAPAPAGL